MARSQRQSQKAQAHSSPQVADVAAKQNSLSTEALILQSSPHRFEFGEGQVWDIMLDRVFCMGQRVLIAGWSSLQCSFRLVCNNIFYEVETTSVYREDVNKHLDINSQSSLGFALSAVCSDCEKYEIKLEISNAQFNYTNVFPLQKNTLPANLDDASAAFGGLFSSVLGEICPFTDEWEKLVVLAPSKKAPTACFEGAIEHAVYTAFTKQTLIFGWLAYQEGLTIWVCDETGKMYKPEAVHRFPREDVSNHLGSKYGISRDHGVIIVVNNFPNADHFTIKIFHEAILYEFEPMTISNSGYDIKAFAAILFGLPLSSREFVAKVDSLFYPLLSPVHAQYREQFEDQLILTREIGTQLQDSKLSIIVPLYGRYDFVDMQLFDFIHDQWVLQHCELIYVVDDSTILSGFLEHMELLHPLVNIPLKCVWGGINRGFSGANNLGASVARAETLLFLNSDVFMNTPGGFEHMYDVLQQDSSIGAVGARLLRADGSIQHAGMVACHSKELDIWINDHPRAGCAPELDPASTPVDMPAVTGACLMIRKSHFVAANRWNEEYFMGDFEDSDLCFTLRKQNLRVVYCADSSFTHLERQSISCMNTSPDFRQKVTLYNAVIHQNRWNSMFSRLTESHSTENTGSNL